MMFIEMLFDNPQILAVGAPDQVERVADQWHRAKHRVDPDVRSHPHQLPFRHSQIARFPNHISTHCRRNDIAEHRHQPDNRIQPERDFGAGDGE